jgi:ABC-2 type transport system ATP-binding protein
LQHSIEAEGLGRKFGERWAVQGLDLHIPVGEVFGLLGPNGAGKTTTMRMLAALIEPSAGRAVVCGYDLLRERREVRRSVGVMTESPGLYENLSSLQNLRFFCKLYDIPPREADRQIRSYLELLGLWERRNDATATFSKGMKQKLSIARALLHEPQVVILDEPTSALDPEGARLVRDFIGSLKDKGRTIILCTHNLFEAQSLCDRVAIIRNKLLRVGTPRDLQRSLYGRHIEVRIGNALPDYGGDPDEVEGLHTMNDYAVALAALNGLGDVAVSGDTLLIATLDPDEITPGVVRTLVMHGAEVLRVAEVERTLEMAYLDLVSRAELEAALRTANTDESAILTHRQTARGSEGADDRREKIA